MAINRKLDNLGRLTIPVELRKKFQISNSDEIEISFDNNKIILTKSSKKDIFGNVYSDNSYIEYCGHKLAKISILELSRLAGLIN